MSAPARLQDRSNGKTPPPKLLKELRKGAMDAALAAGNLLSRKFGRLLRMSEKTDGTGLVTEADLAAERIVMRMLSKTRPDFDFLAEESGKQRGRKAGSEPEGRWIIDPLDGTTNFVHGFPMFCVSIGAEWRGHLVAGVIYQPVLKDLYVGIHGQGAKVNGRAMRVSNRKTVSESLLTTGFTYHKHRWLKEEMSAFESLSGIARAVRRPGSAALDMAYTARGVFEGFWERGLAPWDTAAGTVLVREAGGLVTTFTGAPFHSGEATILASNGHLHPALVKALAADRD